MKVHFQHLHGCSVIGAPGTAVFTERLKCRSNTLYLQTCFSVKLITKLKFYMLRNFLVTMSVPLTQRKYKKKIEEDEAAEFLDSDEQDQVIEGLRIESEKQNKWFRRAFAVILTLCAVLMVFCLISFFFYPYSMFIHEVYFQDILPPAVIYTFYTVSSMVFSGSAFISLVSFVK